MWKRLLFSTLGLVLMTETWLWFQHRQSPAVQPPEEIKQEPLLLEEVVQSPAVEPLGEITETIRYAVPFTSQAPTGDWTKSAFQDGCEEASSIMVWMARTGQTMTREEVRVKLIDMAKFQEKLLGHGVDTNIEDTNEYLLKQYLEITDARIVEDIALEDLKEALFDGLVIVPTNGRALGNPNFTPPGPLQHMLVLIGYDVATKEFITNDPGTRLGQDYRYSEQVLFDAIREYPTGKHLPVTTGAKSMIVVPFQEKT